MREAVDEVHSVWAGDAQPRSPRRREASRPEVCEAGGAVGAEVGAFASGIQAGAAANAEPGADAAVASLIVGIDPGVNTGLALYAPLLKEYEAVKTLGVVEAMLSVQRLAIEGRIKLVVIEDARLRKWFGNKGREALQGAGSIKRECAIWIDWLNHNAIPYRVVSPQGKGAKVNAERFAKLTGWTQRTSEHARDAAMLVLGVKA